MPSQDQKRRNVRLRLRDVLGRFTSGADKTRVKFVRQTIGGIVLCGGLIGRRWRRWIDDRCREPSYSQPPATAV